MTLSMSDLTTQPPHGDIFWQDKYPAINENDAELWDIVQKAELPVLLASLAIALDKFDLLRPEFSPPLPPLGVGLKPHGGLGPEVVAEGQKVAFEAIKALRDGTGVKIERLSADKTTQLLDWFTGGRTSKDPAWEGQMQHELPLAAHRNGSPDWHYSQYADKHTEPFETLIVGAGISGIAAAYRLQEAGLPFTWIEASHRVGGTWWKNHYPGVRLDTPTYGYSFSFAQRVDWPHQFATGGEVLDYLETVAEKAGLADHIQLNTRLKSARWDEENGVWQATLQHEDGSETAQAFNAIMTGVGQLDHPFIPEWPEQDSFRGAQMHSQEWDHSVDLKGKKVAVIGSGASAYQIVPAIVDDVDQLYLFQRSAPWMLPAPTYHDPMSDNAEWLHAHVPMYGNLFRLFVTAGGIEGRQYIALAEEGWEGAPHSVSAANDAFRQDIIAEIRKQYEDRPDLLEKVIPHYPPSAKRMLRDNGVWSRALKAEHTEVISEGLESFTPNGLVTGDGRELDVDVVIYATGFRPSDYLDPIEIIGRDGIEIHDYWGGDAKGFGGITVPGFPNFYMLMGPNTGGVVAGGLHFMIERAAEYAVKCFKEIFENNAKALDLKQEALDEHIEWVDNQNYRMTWGQPYVKTWYKNKFNRVSQVWPFATTEYWRITDSVQTEDYEFLR